MPSTTLVESGNHKDFCGNEYWPTYLRRLIRAGQATKWIPYQPTFSKPQLYSMRVSPSTSCHNILHNMPHDIFYWDMGIMNNINAYTFGSRKTPDITWWVDFISPWRADYIYIYIYIYIYSFIQHVWVTEFFHFIKSWGGILWIFLSGKISTHVCFSWPYKLPNIHTHTCTFSLQGSCVCNTK